MGSRQQPFTITKYSATILKSMQQRRLYQGIDAGYHTFGRSFTLG
jgi:hypothetical protein